MRFFKRTPEPVLSTCQRCGQLVDPEAVDCPVCGHDLREAYVARMHGTVPVPEGSEVRSP